MIKTRNQRVDNRRNITIQAHGAREGCYVTTFQGPLSVWKAYKRGAYADASEDGTRHDERSSIYEEKSTIYAQAMDIIRARGIRWGAYGDPAMLPLFLVEGWTDKSARWTGYTHQWRADHADGFQGYLMASVESDADKAEANARGWRTFRVNEDAQPMKDEIVCPASDEGGKVTDCQACGLCNGAEGSVQWRADARNWKRPENGVIIYEGPSVIDGAPIVAIATGFKSPSSNDKTGTMIQVWILRADIAPHEAQKTGADESICGDCPMRPLLVKMARAR
jgi:hypothetical protein